MNGPARFVVVVLGSAVYFSLAILGWGGIEPFFSHSPLIALTIAVFAMAAAAAFADGNLRRATYTNLGPGHYSF